MRNRQLTDWAFNLMQTNHFDRNTKSGVVGYGNTHPNSNDCCIWVGTDTDLSDKNIYPDFYDGVKIIYKRIEAPREQESQSTTA